MEPNIGKKFRVKLENVQEFEIINRSTPTIRWKWQKYFKFLEGQQKYNVNQLKSTNMKTIGKSCVLIEKNIRYEEFMKKQRNKKNVLSNYNGN